MLPTSSFASLAHRVVALPRQTFESKLLVVLRMLLLGYIGLAYGEALNYFTVVSPYLLYATYLSVYSSVAICFVLQHEQPYLLLGVLVYLFWLVGYSLWGLLVSPYTDAYVSEVVRTLVRVTTVLVAFPIAVQSRPHVVVLSRVIQIAVVVNCAVCIGETFNPDLTWAIAHLLVDDVSVVDPLRKAGLWFNANHAAYAFLVGLLLSHWSTGWLAWIARLAAVIGIYLTVSRSGLYLLLLCAMLYSVFHLHRIRITRGHVMLGITGAAVLVSALLFLVTNVTSDIRLGNSWNVQRLLDFKEESGGELSRGELSGIALEHALNGSWHGRGILSFQGGPHSPFWERTNVGAHNIYIVVLGETGVPGIVGYAALLIFGVALGLKTPMRPDDRFVLMLLWLVYFVIGLVFHNQFTAFASTVFAGVLFHLPLALRTPAQPSTT